MLGFALLSGGIQFATNHRHRDPRARSREGTTMLFDRTDLQIGMEVVGVDGYRVGEVKEVRATDFLVDRTGHRDIYVPFSAIQAVTAEKVSLSIPVDQVDGMDWDSPSPTS
jgi:hypothetical protein